VYGAGKGMATWTAGVGIRFCGCDADKQKFRSVLELKLMWGCGNVEMWKCGDVEMRTEESAEWQPNQN